MQIVVQSPGADRVDHLVLVRLVSAIGKRVAGAGPSRDAHRRGGHSPRPMQPGRP